MKTLPSTIKTAVFDTTAELSGCRCFAVPESISANGARQTPKEGSLRHAIAWPVATRK